MNNKSENNLYNLLRIKEIITILDGDTKLGIYETEDGKRIPVAMPYLSGPALCELSVQFGLATIYSWDGKNQSRWVYLDNLLEYCIGKGTVSELISYLFSIDQFKSILKDNSPEDIEKAYQHIVKQVLSKINGILYFGGHELIEDNGNYYVRSRN